MKYTVTVMEHGFGCVLKKPEYHLGIKFICDEVFDNKEEALERAREETVKLYDKYDICKKWYILRDRFTLKHIKTDCERNKDDWYHQFEVEVMEFTDEQWKEAE